MRATSDEHGPANRFVCAREFSLAPEIVEESVRCLTQCGPVSVVWWLSVCVAAVFGATASRAADDAIVPVDDWCAIRFDDEPVGYERVTTRPATELERAGRELAAVHRHRETRLNLKRFGTDLSVTASLETTETIDGRLLSFSLSRTDASGATIERSGLRDAESGAFVIEEKVQATRRRYSLSAPLHVWSPIMSGWVGEPLLANAARSTRPVLFPETAAVADVVLEGGRTRTVNLSGNLRVKLLSASFHPSSDPAQRTAVFVDDAGKVVVQENTVLGGTLRLERTTAEEALTSAAGKSLDLDTIAVIPIDRALNIPAAGGSHVLELRAEGPLRIDIPEGTFQRVERTSDSSVKITLLPMERKRGTSRFLSARREPLAGTRWMPTHDPRVQQLALAGAVGEVDSMQLCLRLERYLHSKMRHSPFSTATIPADQVAQSLRGDCTEHAVLLAALIRVHGIPSRVVSGLVAADHGAGFVGHMWVEAKVGDDWIPFDSTLKSTDFSVPHIRLADSEMPDDMSSSVTLFVPVLDLTGRTTIHVRN